MYYRRNAVGSYRRSEHQQERYEAATLRWGFSTRVSFSSVADGITVSEYYGKSQSAWLA
jgi:hypothetical protein